MSSSEALAQMQLRIAEEVATWNRLRALERRVRELEWCVASLEATKPMKGVSWH